MPWRHMREWGIALPFLTSTLDGSKWSVSHPTLFTSLPRRRSHWDLLDRWLGGPQNQSGHRGIEKIPCLCQELNPGQVAHHHTDWAIPAHQYKACAVFSPLNTGIKFSNPTWSMDVSLHFFHIVLSRVGKELVMGYTHIQQFLTNVCEFEVFRS
jgi:hypothetical protein